MIPACEKTIPPQMDAEACPISGTRHRLSYLVPMKILFVGGTGNISLACSRLALQQGHHLTLLHRKALLDSGILLPGAREILCDICDEAAVERALASRQFDAVVEWIAFTPEQVERDLRLFRGHTGQYIFISSASAYQKPPRSAIITEATPLENPYWDYSRNKIACEDLLWQAAQTGFPMTIVRPSLTYDTVLPVPIGGWTEFTIVERMRQGLPIVIHGDGYTPWTITHAEDFAQGFLPLLGHPRALGEAFHITSDEHPGWIEIYQLLAEAAGVKADLRICPLNRLLEHAPSLRGTLLGDKAWPAVFDNTKIRSIAPQFRARIPFREGIQRTVQWFDAKEERRRIQSASNKLLDELVKLCE